MGEQTWQDITDEERELWGPGPWLEEPTKVQWIDATTGFDCLIVRNRHGSLCGYVGVPPGHRAHGLDYSAVGADCHGSLTFADGCDEIGAVERPGRAICHVPAPGRPADIWWLGFDCGHFMDLSPGLAALEREYGMSEMLRGTRFEPTYRDLAYVHDEVTALAAQLA